MSSIFPRRLISEIIKNIRLIDLVPLVILSYIVRLIFFVQPNIIHTDGAQYATIGENIFAGNGYRGIYTGGAIDLLSSPLYPILVGATDFIIGNLSLSAHLISFLFGGAVVVPTYYLTKRIYDKNIAIFSGLLVIFHPNLIQYSTEAVVESLYTFILICILYIGFRAYDESSPVLYFLTGFLLALGYLTKPETIGYLGMFIVVSIAYHVIFDRNHPKILRRRTKYALYSLVAFLSLSAPYILFLYFQTGEFTLGGKSGVNIVLAQYVTSNDPYAYEKLAYGLTSEGDLRTTIWNETGPSVLGYILSHPTEILVRVITNLKKFYYSLIPSILPPLLTGLFAIGVISSKPPKKRLIQVIALFVVVVYPLISYSLFFARQRYLIPFIPICLILAAAGMPQLTSLVEDLWDLFTGHSLPRWVYTIVVVLIIILPLILQSGFMGLTSNEPLQQKEGGEWLEENTDEDAIVMARKPMAAFYGDRTYWQLPFASYDEVISFARDRGVDYMILTERYSEPNRPQLAFLLNQSAEVPSELELVYVDEKSAMFIYEIQYPTNSTSYGDQMNTSEEMLIKPHTKVDHQSGTN